MTTDKTTWFENEVIDHYLRAQAANQGTAYVALYTVAPTEAGGGTEVSAGNYARQTCGFSAPSDGVTSNASDITFGEATVSYGTVVACAIHDASSAGNMLYFGNLTASKTVDAGDTFKFLAGDLQVTET